MARVNAAERADRARAQARADGRIASPGGQIFGRANPLALCGMYGCLGYSGNFFLFLLPNYLETKRHLDKTTTMWLTSLPFCLRGVRLRLGGVLLRLPRAAPRGAVDGAVALVGARGMAIAAAAIVATLAVTDLASWRCSSA